MGRWDAMSIAECFNAVAGKRLAVVGFLSKKGARDYGHRGGLEFNSLPTEQVRELLVKGEYTPANLERLRAALQADIATLQCQYSWANCLAIATPGLELLTNEEVESLKLEFFSQIQVLTDCCVEQKFTRVGLLGATWDVCSGSPLVVALKQQGIEPLVLDVSYHAPVTACAAGALHNYIQHQGRMLSADDYCVEAVGQMIHEACGTMQALVICNPELRPLMSLLRSKRKQVFARTTIIDLPGLYWDFLSKQLSQSQEKSPS